MKARDLKQDDEFRLEVPFRVMAVELTADHKVKMTLEMLDTCSLTLLHECSEIELMCRPSREFNVYRYDDASETEWRAYLESDPETFVKLPDGRYCLREHLHELPKADVLPFRKPDNA